MPSHGHRSPARWLLLPAAAMVIVCFVAPWMLVLATAFTSEATGQFTLDNFSYVLGRTAYRPPAVRTILLATGAAGSAVMFALPASFYLALYSRRGRAWLFMLTVTFWVDFVVRILAWKVFLGPSPLGALLGPEVSGVFLYNNFSVLVARAYAALPLCLSVIFVAISNLDRGIIEAAQHLGASSWQLFVHIVWPLVRKPVGIAFLLAFIYGTASFLEAEMLGNARTVMIGTLLRDHFERALSWHIGSAMALLMLILIAILIATVLRTASFLRGSWLR
jgi:spermidine/putrescine transport system permease protein